MSRRVTCVLSPNKYRLGETVHLTYLASQSIMERLGLSSNSRSKADADDAVIREPQLQSKYGPCNGSPRFRAGIVLYHKCPCRVNRMLARRVAGYVRRTCTDFERLNFPRGRFGCFWNLRRYIC